MVHTLPFVPPASNVEQQGFVRIINNSDRAGVVRITAIDDDGQPADPVTLSLKALGAAHFNSQELENGNPEKGLEGRAGDGDGNWRLKLETNLEIEHLAYIRTTEDGFVTNMHEVAAEIPEGSNRYHVPFLNPGSNTAQVSKLRLINPGSGDASIEITGVDDDGRALGSVSLDLDAGMARILTASELESGESPHTQLAGGLGDGTGKWRLSVSADRPIQVMSLLQLPTGHLTNLSRGQDGVAVPPPPPPTNEPDLVVESPSVSDSTLNTGQSFTFRATVRNQGGGRSAVTTLRYYRSSDMTISMSDTGVGTDAVGGLSASDTSAESIVLTAPSSAGTYYYGACVDTVSGESNTANNCSNAVRVSVSSGGGGEYGALSYDFGVSDSCPGLAAGIAVNHRSAQEALNAARRACQDDGGSASTCRSDSGWFQNSCVALHYCFSSILRRCSVVTRTGPTLSATESRPTDCLPSSLWTHRIWTNTSGQRMSGCSFGSNSGAGAETTGRTLFQMQSKSLGAP